MASSLNETIREDGLRIITKKLPNSKRFRLAIIAGVGSAYDPPEYDGLAHFFEHMAFGGTKTRSSSEINSELSRYTLSHNAETGSLETTYWGESVYVRSTEMTDLLFDLYLNPTFPEAEIAKEKEVVKNEIASNEDSDSFQAYQALWKALWRKNPLRKYGSGTPESINLLTRNQLTEAHRTWYVPSNTVIIGTGHLNHPRLIEKINALFPLNYRRFDQLKFDHEALEPPVEKNITIERPGKETGLIILGCKIPPFDTRTLITVRMLNTILGSRTDSMLQQEIRDKKGYAYSVGSGINSSHHRLGYYFYATASVLPTRIEETTQLMLATISNTPINPNHFENTKQTLLDQSIAAMEDPYDWQGTIKYEILERGGSLSDIVNYIAKANKTIKSISYEEIIELREKLLTPDRMVCVIAKPV